jgi:beta-galactosidase
MTEYVYSKSVKTREIFDNLSRYRAGNCWEATCRALLLNAVMPDTIDIQNNVINGRFRVLIVPSASYMSKEVQQKLLNYVAAGGGVLLHGKIPQYDLEGNKCTILAEALGVTGIEHLSGFRRDFAPAVKPQGVLAGVMREYPCADIECYDIDDGESFLTVYHNAKTCGFYKDIGAGRMAAITCEFKSHLEAYKRIMDVFGFKGSLTHDIDVPGCAVFMTMTENPAGERFLYLINLDDIDKEFNVYYNGACIVPDRKIFLPAGDALTLPLGVDLGFARVVYSTLELMRVDGRCLYFRNTEKHSKILLSSVQKPVAENWLSVSETAEGYLITTDNRCEGEEVCVVMR